MSLSTDGNGISIAAYIQIDDTCQGSTVQGRNVKFAAHITCFFAIKKGKTGRNMLFFQSLCQLDQDTDCCSIVISSKCSGYSIVVSTEEERGLRTPGS